MSLGAEELIDEVTNLTGNLNVGYCLSAQPINRTGVPVRGERVFPTLSSWLDHQLKVSVRKAVYVYVIDVKGDDAWWRDNESPFFAPIRMGADGVTLGDLVIDRDAQLVRSNRQAAIWVENAGGVSRVYFLSEVVAYEGDIEVTYTSGRGGKVHSLKQRSLEDMLIDLEVSGFPEEVVRGVFFKAIEGEGEGYDEALHDYVLGLTDRAGVVAYE